MLIGCKYIPFTYRTAYNINQIPYSNYFAIIYKETLTTDNLYFLFYQSNLNFSLEGFHKNDIVQIIVPKKKNPLFLSYN